MSSRLPVCPRLPLTNEGSLLAEDRRGRAGCVGLAVPTRHLLRPASPIRPASLEEGGHETQDSSAGG